MADTPISGLSSAPTVSSSDAIPVVHAGSTYKGTPAQIFGAVRRGGISVAAAADGTASVTITFSPAFSSLTKLDAPAFVNYTGTDVPVFTYTFSAVSASGFTFEIYGGQTGTHVDVHWGATGS